MGRSADFAAGWAPPERAYSIPAPGTGSDSDEGQNKSSDLFEAMEHAQSGE